MKQNLQNLLDRIYELEGLVHLSLSREDNLDELISLICRKGSEVESICLNLLPQDETEKKEDHVEKLNPLSDFEVPEYSIEDEIDSVENEDNETDRDETQEITQELKDELKKVSEPKNGKLVFSINERFRFRKELFDDSDANFNTTLALVASMDNYDEAEDYFLNEIGFESSDPIVVEFMDVIKRYFK